MLCRGRRCMHGVRVGNAAEPTQNLQAPAHRSARAQGVPKGRRVELLQGQNQNSAKRSPDKQAFDSRSDVDGSERLATPGCRAAGGTGVTGSGRSAFLRQVAEGSSPNQRTAEENSSTPCVPCIPCSVLCTRLTPRVCGREQVSVPALSAGLPQLQADETADETAHGQG